ncbi:MAG: hypothetical protein FWC76_02115 [Defluviitaleaceae bacterium]|nr:hypothetical protein [Defluviitaleaceae bacterium]
MTRRKWIFIAIVALVIAVALFIVINNNWRSPSGVDASPLSQLTAEQVGRIDEIWKQLEQHENVRWLHTSDEPLDPFDHGQQYLYTLRWDNGNQKEIPNAWLLIQASVFSGEQTAINRMQWFIEDISEEDRHRPSVAVINENNTEVLLDYMYFDALFVDRRHPIPGFNRHIWSRIRIGHVEITLTERRPRSSSENYSSQFIATLVEMLQEVEQP